MTTRLNPALVVKVRKQVIAWNRELRDPWIPSPAALSIAQTIKGSSPTMAKLLTKAEILEPWAEMLHDQVLLLMKREVDQGREAGEALNRAMLELVPATPETEAEWLEANSLPTRPEELATA
jgi:hypothetical protein